MTSIIAGLLFIVYLIFFKEAKVISRAYQTMQQTGNNWYKVAQDNLGDNCMILMRVPRKVMTTFLWPSWQKFNYVGRRGVGT